MRKGGWGGAAEGATTSPFEILDVSLYHPDIDHLLTGWVETPCVGDRVDGHTLTIDGGAFSRHGEKAVTIECGIPGVILSTAQINVARPDIAAHYPATFAATAAGFRM